MHGVTSQTVTVGRARVRLSLRQGRYTVRPMRMDRSIGTVGAQKMEDGGKMERISFCRLLPPFFFARGLVLRCTDRLCSGFVSAFRALLGLICFSSGSEGAGLCVTSIPVSANFSALFSATYTRSSGSLKLEFG